MPWWLLRVYIDGLDKEFSPEEDPADGPEESTDDITQLGITPIQIQ